MRAATVRRAVPLVVGLVAALAALIGLDARATYGARVSGDEPQYLLTATSIGEDVALDISDEIAARRFVDYHEVALDTQTLPLDDSGRQVSPHDPLLPAVLAVPMRLGGWQAAKVVLAVIGGLTATVTTWVAMRRLRVSPAAAGVGVGAAFVGLTLAAYGTQVYPEMPAALATVVAVAALTGRRMATRHVALSMLTIVVLPWLAVKYAPVAIALFAWLVWRLWPDRRRVGEAIAAAAVAGAVYLVVHRLWYGGWTVYSTGDHFAETGEFSVVGTDVDLLGRSQRLAGLVVDRDFGIAAWAPVWLLAPFALGGLLASSWRWRWWATAVLAAGWLNATFVALTMHGFWVPGRQIVVVLPVAALALALLADRSRRWRWVVGVSGVLGAVNWTWLAVEASTGRRTLIVDFASTAAWPYRALREVLPNGLVPTGGSRTLLTVWAVVLVASIVVGWRTSTRRRARPTIGV